MVLVQNPLLYFPDDPTMYAQRELREEIHGRPKQKGNINMYARIPTPFCTFFRLNLYLLEMLPLLVPAHDTLLHLPLLDPKPT